MIFLHQAYVLSFQVHFDLTFEKEYTGLGAAFGFVQTLVAPGTSSLLSFNNSAEYEGLAGIMGDRQHTLWKCHKHYKDPPNTS